jgi:hypothetical protein
MREESFVSGLWSVARAQEGSKQKAERSKQHAERNLNRMLENASLAAVARLGAYPYAVRERRIY